MGDLLKARMRWGTVGHKVRETSDAIMNKTFTNDLGWKNGKLYDQNGDFLEEIDLKYQYSQNYTIAKDQVDYLVQFRPGYFPEKKYRCEDGIERLGFYLELRDDNSGDMEKWLVVGRNDKNNFIRYNILKCNWVFKWVVGETVFSQPGVMRNRNNYNSGVWSDGFFTTVENQTQFILPTNNVTRTIDYNMRFMLSDNPIHPLVYKVSKIEDLFPMGIYKVTLKQDHYDPEVDNAEEKICGYNVNLKLTPHKEINRKVHLEVDGVRPELHIGGSKRIISVVSDDELAVEWSFSCAGEAVTDKFTIEVTANTAEISVEKDYSLIGKILTVYADNETLGIHESIELEVKR